LKDFKEFIEAKKAVAKGVYFLKPIKKDGKVIDVKVYKTKPDNQAIEQIFDRVIGKSTENLDLTSAGEKIEGFTYIVPKNET